MGVRTVLIIDDDASITIVLTAILEDQGYHVVSALNEAALQLAHDAQPDVILLDLMMPHMHGADICGRLRADPVTALIPIIAMSACHQLEHATRTMAVNARMAKPFDLGDLCAVVAYWAARPRTLCA